MPSRPLWHIPDPEEAVRQAMARHELAERHKRDRATEARARKRRARVEEQLLRERETRLRAKKRAEWLATHQPPTADELAALMREKAPNLLAAMERKRK